MSNTIKYSESTEQRALNKGNWWIGTGDSNKGPTVESGYWNAINPPDGGYTIYLNKESNGPSIHSITSDENLISFTNKISGNNYTTVAECLVYYQTQDDKLCVNREMENIVTDGLVLNLDAGYVPSYPTSGTTWHDLSGNGNNGTLVNGTIFSGGSMVFDGVDDYILIPTYTFGNGDWTLSVWVNTNSMSNYNIMSNSSGGPVANAFGFQGGNIFYRNYDGTWQNNSGNSILSTGEWYFLTWVNYGGATAQDGTMKMFVNGVPDSGVFNSYTTNGGPCNTIGRNWFSYYNGKIANVYIQTKSLSDDEVLQNYNAQKGRFGL